MRKVTRAIGLAVVCAAWAAGDPASEGREGLIRYLNGIAKSQLDQRARDVANIKTRADAERRKVLIREKILRLIGGVFEHRGPVAVKQFGELAGDGFRIEKIAYESLPGFWVTANVYVPAGAGPFPAVTLSPGHEAGGKLGQYNFGANMARMGILALAVDPLGQGERLQYFDPEKKASTIGGSTGEHGEANVQTMLIGENLARYFVNDLMRGIDYLSSRKDVNADRIGAFGCSGGGTATAYLAALDDRVKVAGIACYITSYEELFASRAGVQEAEQSIPHMIEQGLDLADWVEVVAPKPYAIVSTTNDMFPFAGARHSYEEAQRIFKLYDAGDRLQWITGPGGHGNLGPIAPTILGFFARYLKDAPPGEASFTPMRAAKPTDLLCTPTGQISTSIGGETVYSINRKRAAEFLVPPRGVASRAELERFQTRLRADVRAITAAAARPGSKPVAVDVTATEQRSGYRLETILLHSETGIDVSGLIAIPDRAGAKPAVLMLDPQLKKTAALGGDLDRLATSGRIVMGLDPRPTPVGTEENKSPYLGVYNLLSLRAFMVGKTIVGMRVDDTLRAVDWLASRKDVDGAAITAYARGAAGVALLHAAVLDTRIRRVFVEDTLASYRMAVDQPMHRGISEAMLPGVLRKYDLGDLLLAISPRPVTVINPQDALGALLGADPFRQNINYVLESDRKLGAAKRVQITSRNEAERLPID